MTNYNIYKLDQLKEYLHTLPKPKTEGPISVEQLQNELETKDILFQSSDDFLKKNTSQIRSIIEKIKLVIEFRITECSINTRNFKSKKVMNDIMTNMYELKTEEIDERTLDPKMNVKILNDVNFVSQHFLNETNGKNVAVDKRESLESSIPYEQTLLQNIGENPTKNALYNQTFINLQKLYANQGVGFMKISITLKSKPYAIIMRNILGYIVYNCNADHYIKIYTQMKNTIQEIINKGSSKGSYEEMLMAEDILDSDIKAKYNSNPISFVKILTDYLGELLTFVNNVLVLLESNNFTDHLLLNIRDLTYSEKNDIASITPILQKNAEDKITKNRDNKNLIVNIHYGDIYNEVWESIITDPNSDFKRFVIMFGLKTTKNTGFNLEETKQRLSKRKDLVFQIDVFKSRLYHFKFNEVKSKSFNINVTPDNLDKELYLTTMAMVIHNFTIDEKNKFNYVEPMKGFSPKSNYQLNLYHIYSEVITDLPDKFNDIMNKYIECFRDFVFRKDSIALGLGAYLISLIIFPYLPYKWVHSQAIQQDINLSVFHELSCFDSIYSFVEETAHVYGDYPVECFHQAPYMLGFFSGINPSRRAGTCQDNALIRLMKYDMNNELYGMSMVNYPKITHWNAVDSESKFNQCDKGLIITHNGVITFEGLGNRPPTVTDTDLAKERSKLLVLSDVQRIKNNNYQARANVFLAMTMAHVYRHTYIKDEDNNENGVAFKQIDELRKPSSFEKAVLKYITDNVHMTNTNISNDTESNQQKFNFSSIENIFDRYYEPIVDDINNKKTTKESTFGGGGKPNPYIKVGKYNNRTIYKKKNTLYVRVKDSTTNKMVYKRLTKSMKR